MVPSLSKFRTSLSFALLVLCLSPTHAAAETISVPLLGTSVAQEKSGDTLKMILENGINARDIQFKQVLLKCSEGKLFHLFFTQLDTLAPSHVIQRAKRIKSYFKGTDLQPFKSEIDFMVEAFKTKAGHLKHNDRHHGIFHLGKAERLEVTKELEIGIAELPSLPTSQIIQWPFDSAKLYVQIQKYQPDPQLYNQVQFKSSKNGISR